MLCEHIGFQIAIFVRSLQIRAFWLYNVSPKQCYYPSIICQLVPIRAGDRGYYRDHSGHELGQWENALHSHAFSHWPNSCPEWSQHRFSRRMSGHLLKELGHQRTQCHYNGVIMGAMASQITSLTIVYSIVYSGADQIKHQSSASLDFVWGIHRSPVNSPHKGPATGKMFSFDDVVMADSMSWSLRVQIPSAITISITFKLRRPSTIFQYCRRDHAKPYGA